MPADAAPRDDSSLGIGAEDAARAKALFAAAIEKPAPERAQFLSDAGADTVVRAEVEALLFAHDLCEQAARRAAPAASASCGWRSSSHPCDGMSRSRS